MAERTVRSMERAGRYRLPGAWTGVLGLALLGLGLALAAPSLAEEGNASPAKSEQTQRQKADWTWEEITKAGDGRFTDEQRAEMDKGDPSSPNYVPPWKREKPVVPAWENQETENR
ncbi:MAG: hypothetical protein RIB84_00945 [Sneathiellaceae bacterium]